jgi:TfoX/Sxy family transcriptional regulator of competence genes
VSVEEQLLKRVRAAFADTTVREVKMFGGIGFMLQGNMVVAASSRGLLVRLDEAQYQQALERPGAAPMVMRGRALKSYIRVAPDALDARAVKMWVRIARAYVETLPPKKKKPARKRGSAR